ncbi:hypothetical protein BDZ45DRAFT_724718 [Acephala macrosclerotiorum]|nr:hypothetical protein BDZ45DRAFT_724718 [Acephala macrosclerotiorum]
MRYDGKGFSTFPAMFGQTGFKVTNSFQLPPPQRKMVWFGMGHEVLGPEFSGGNMITLTLQGEVILTTALLPELCERWALAKQNAESSRETHLHQKFCFQVAYNVLHTFYAGEGPKPSKLILKLVLSFCEYLTMTVIIGYGRKGRDWGAIRGRWACGQLPAPQDAFDSMLEAGWCPSEIERVDGTFQLPAALVAARAVPNIKSIRLSANATPACDYAKVHADKTKLLEILKKGRIPLLRVVTRPGSTEVELEVVESSPDTPYVAISHVWKDGMEDTKSNALLDVSYEAPPETNLSEDLESFLLDHWMFDGHSTKAPSDNEEPSTDSETKLSTSTVPLMKALAAGSLGPLLRNFLIEAAPSERLGSVPGEMFEKILADDDIRRHLRILLEDIPLIAPAHMQTECSSAANTVSNFDRNVMKKILWLRFVLWKSPLVVKEFMCAVGILLGSMDASLRTAIENFALATLALERWEFDKEGIATSAFCTSDPEPILHWHEPLEPITEQAEEPNGKLNLHSLALKTPTHPGFVRGQSSPSTKTSQPLLLWIDTICCPTGPPWAKTPSIQRLRQTYEDTTYVLVIDSYLTSIPATKPLNLEKLFRILLLVWTR